MSISSPFLSILSEKKVTHLTLDGNKRSPGEKVSHQFGLSKKKVPYREAPIMSGPEPLMETIRRIGSTPGVACRDGIAGRVCRI
jgi:hypothetical protein